jgi:hypothetical protein
MRDLRRWWQREGGMQITWLAAAFASLAASIWLVANGESVLILAVSILLIPGGVRVVRAMRERGHLEEERRHLE